MVAPKQLKAGDYIRDTDQLGWKTLPEIFESMAEMIPDVSSSRSQAGAV